MKELKSSKSDALQTQGHDHSLLFLCSQILKKGKRHAPVLYEVHIEQTLLSADLSGKRDGCESIAEVAVRYWQAHTTSKI